MNYVGLALLAMAGYTLVAPLLKVALADIPRAWRWSSPTASSFSTRS
jgi:hypothetical protein